MVRMNADLLMGELLKKTGAGNLFTVFGEPDIASGRDERRHRRRPQGRRRLRPDDRRGAQQRAPSQIALWMIDTDYNEESFFVRHCYFTGGNDPYKRLKTALKADIDAEAWESLYQTSLAPVPAARDRQDRRQGHQRLRRRGHEGLRGLTRSRGSDMPTYASPGEAIACLDEPLQIIACAGSGKTQVISQRIAAILSLPGVEPRNVVAFTFTEKAAAELKDRIYSILEQDGVDGPGWQRCTSGRCTGTPSTCCSGSSRRPSSSRC